MLFFLSTPNYINEQLNTTKVKVHLKNGIAEILDQHQDLMGNVENDLIEIETNFENKIEKFIFVVQQAIFVVSHKGLDNKAQKKGTSIYVYAKDVREINSSISLDENIKQYEKKKLELSIELKKLEDEKEATKKLNPTNVTTSNLTNSQVLLLQQDVDFLKTVISIVKSTK
jgi:hypothetical protein